MPAVLDPATATPRRLRREIRIERHTGHTVGYAPRHAQGHLVVVPRVHADDFLRYGHRNPKPCPLLAVGIPGDPSSPTLGQLMTDLLNHQLAAF